MPALILDDLHKAYGTNTLLDGVSLRIEGDWRVGVIGRNGCGKSTLLRIILGLEQADAGEVVLADGLTLGYLEQQDPFRPGESALAYMERASGQAAWRCGEVAGGFEMGPDLLAAEATALSGGWQTRLRLAAMLARDPGFLVLDEPTNYLDLKTVLLLEDFLASFKGGWLLVSHDREFLRRTCGRTLSVGQGKATLYPGTVDAWLEYQAEQRRHIEAVNANTEAKRRFLEDFIARNKARASTATRAQSKAKELEKLETIEVDRSEAEVRIRVPSVELRKGWGLRCQGLAIGYGERRIAGGIELELERGSRVAVLGDNGQGKTTFLRTIAGDLAPLGGSLRWGHGIRVGCFAQHVYRAIPDGETVLAHLRRMAALAEGPAPKDQELLDHAGSFLFRGADVDKPAKVLSGGERARLCLAGLLLARREVLLLDEPTNHLDFATVEALAAALAKYDGTILFTCHDRSFVATVATHVIEVKDAAVKVYGDGYEAYLWRLGQEVRTAHQAREAAHASAPASPEPVTGRDTRERQQKARNRLKAIERELPRLDAERKALEATMAAEPSRWELAQQHTALKAKIAALEEEWLELSG